MSNIIISSSLTKKKFAVAFLLFAFGFLSMAGYAQIKPFNADSIPLVDDEVVFTVRFEEDLTKDQFREIASGYLNSALDPYSGSFIKNSLDSAICRVIDYLEIESSFLRVSGVYMTYDMKFKYQDGFCDLTIRPIQFMEKSYYEAQAKESRNLNMPEYTGKEILVDKKYTQILIKNASQKITDATLKRLNEVVKELEQSFAI